MDTLRIEQATLGYGKHTVGENISLDFNTSEIISIIGPNGSGKSTVLKALGRIAPPLKGTVYLNGKDIQKMSTRTVAQCMSIVAQSATAPMDTTVRDLVMCGRLPYQKALKGISQEDIDAVNEALIETSLKELEHRPLRALSGGERQRAWLAMAIAQRPSILLLDEPTTYLDVHYQLELMKLIEGLHKRYGMTIIMVLHDLNHAARFSHRLVAVKKGRIVADGPVSEIFKKDVLEELYQVKMAFFDVEEEGEMHHVCIPYDSVSGV